MKSYLGIDPGKTGAAALIHDDGELILDWPGDVALVADHVRQWKFEFNIQLAALEKVTARPGQGVVSMFSFGQNLGSWQGILSALSIAYLMPTPQAWQKGLVDRKSGDDPKSCSLATARRLFPDAELHLKKHHGRADALLLAWWAKSQGGV